MGGTFLHEEYRSKRRMKFAQQSSKVSLVLVSVPAQLNTPNTSCFKFLTADKMYGKKDNQTVVRLHELHLKGYAKHLALNPLQGRDMHEIGPEHPDYFSQRLAYFETTSGSMAMPDPRTHRTPSNNALYKAACGNSNHLDLTCHGKAERSKRFNDKYLFYTLRQQEYRRSLPGYANFIKSASQVQGGCTLDAVVELFRPFTGILTRSLLVFFDFHHSKNRWKHHLNNVQIWPAHNIDPRVPQSCVLITGLSYEDEEAEDEEMDRWLLMWLKEHELEAKPQLQCRYKTALLYDLVDLRERYRFVRRIVRERDQHRQELSDAYVGQEEWKGKCCLKSRYETSMIDSKVRRLRSCRERQSLLRYCVVSGIEESMGPEGKARKRTREAAINGDCLEDGDAVVGSDLGKDEETIFKSASPDTSDEEVTSAAGSP